MADTIAAPNTTVSQLQSLHGIFAVYKKRGPTSAEVLGRLKKKLLREAGVANPKSRKRKKQLKIGHGGTLDSNSSGVLVIGIGEGTKMLTSLLKGPKKYTAVAELGIATDTLDLKGNVVEEKKYDHITKEALEEKLKEFTGEIMQVPPLYSALKKNGKRMAALMKQGQEVEPKPARPVRVYGLSLQDFSPPLFTLELESGSGCHVRSLVDDLGKGIDPDQAGGLHLGGCVKGGSLDVRRHLSSFEALPSITRARDECQKNKTRGINSKSKGVAVEQSIERCLQVVSDKLHFQ